MKKTGLTYGAVNNHFPVYLAIFAMVTNNQPINWVILEQACSWPVRRQSFAKTPSFYHNKFSYLWCDKVTVIARFSIPTILKFMFTTMMTKFLLVVIWWSDIEGTSSLLGWWRNVPARQGGMTYLKVRPWWLMRRIYSKCSSLVGSLWLPQKTNQDLSRERCQLDIFEGERSQSGDLDD